MAFPFTSTSVEYKTEVCSLFDLRYTVYFTEIRKRLVYIGLSFVAAFACAYTERVALMYSITLSLERCLSDQAESGLSSCVLDWFASVNVFSYFLHDLVSCGTSGFDDVLSLTRVGNSVALSNRESKVALIFTDIEEAFYALLSISLLGCFLACLPVLVYHVLCFLQPGFYIYQRRYVWSFVTRCLVLIYGALRFIDSFFIPRLVSFFYSFEIERSALSLHAETKVLSYVSLYVFVCSITVVLVLVAIAWVSYKCRQIRHGFDQVGLLRTNPFFSNLSSRDLDMSKCKASNGDQGEKWGGQYYNVRGKIWWGCLLAAALISPPEIFSQLICAFFLMVWSEIGMWLGYTSACRSWAQIFRISTLSNKK